MYSITFYCKGGSTLTISNKRKLEKKMQLNSLTIFLMWLKLISMQFIHDQMEQICKDIYKNYDIPYIIVMLLEFNILIIFCYNVKSLKRIMSIAVKQS